MLLGRGVYSYREAATLTGLKHGRVREWFSPSSERQAGAVFRSDFAGETSQPLISFLDLVDVFVAGQLRDRGLSLQTLRKMFLKLQSVLGDSHPFGRRELMFGNGELFYKGIDGSGKEEIVEVLTGQKTFVKIIRPFLKTLSFDTNSQRATTWHIAKDVVVNPEICFGQPVIEAKGMPTNIVATAVKANQNNMDAVASWYGLTIKQVKSACRFEDHLRAA